MADRVLPPEAPDCNCDTHNTGEEATSPLDKKQQLDMTSEGIADSAVSEKVARAHARADRNTRVSRAVQLSPEAIATIVSFLDGLSARMAASQVCHRWREVTLSSPSLWSNISVHELAKENLEADEPYSSKHRHCAYGYSDPEAVIISSNMHHLPLLLRRSAKAPVQLHLRVQVHRDNTLEAAALTTEDVRKFIINSTDNAKTYEKDRLAEIFPGTVNTVVDVLTHMSGLADRLTTLTLRMCCSSWLFLPVFLPPMSALKSLTISDDADRANYNFGKLHYIPESFWKLFQTEATPALPVAFPALEMLQVSGMPGRTSRVRGTTLKISQSRIESLLCSLPSLIRLDISLSDWPAIEPNLAKDDAMADKKLGTGVRTERKSWSVLRNLKHVRLRMDFGYVEQITVNFGHIIDLLPLNSGCSLVYEAINPIRHFDRLLSVFLIDGFRPKGLTITYLETSGPNHTWQKNSRLCAVDVDGNTRTAVASISQNFAGKVAGFECGGSGFKPYIDTRNLTSLAVDTISWTKRLADGFVAPALESLTFIVCSRSLDEAAWGRFEPPTASQLLPKTVTFAVDGSIHQALDGLRLGARPRWRFDWDEGYTPLRLKVYFEFFVRLLQAIHKPSDAVGKLDKIIIAKELKVIPEQAGSEALNRFSDSIDML